MRPFIIIMLLCLSIPCLASPARAAIITVPTDQPTIQAAINVAVDGDVIEILPGIYTGDGNRNLDPMNKAITIRSASGDAGDVLIDAQGSAGKPRRCFRIWRGEGPGTVIEDLSLTGGWTAMGDTPGAGMLIQNSSPILRRLIFRDNHSGWEGGGLSLFGTDAQVIDCEFTDNQAEVEGGGLGVAHAGSPLITGCRFSANQASLGGGVYVHQIATPSIDACVFLQNVASDGGGGLYLRGCPSPIAVTGCVFDGNSGEDGGGIAAYASYLLIAERCTFARNVALVGLRSIGDLGSALCCYGSSHAQVDHCILAFAPAGPAVYGYDVALACCDVFGNDDGPGDAAGQIGVNGNFAADPRFCDLDAGDLRLAGDSPCLPENNGCAALIGALGLGCGPQETVILHADGSGDFPSIQSALDALGAGSTILLSDGLYFGPGNRDLDFHGKAVTLRSESGDPEVCRLLLGGSQAEPHRAMDLDGGAGESPLIEAIGFEGGWALQGGAVRVSGGSAPVFRGCLFRGCAASEAGALHLTGGTVFIEDCEFSGNSAAAAAGAVYAWNSSLSLEGCTLAANTSPFGALFAVSSQVELRFCLLSLNVPAGAAHLIQCETEISCTDIHGNSGGDWSGGLEEFAGLNGNFSQPPFFCDADEGDFSLSHNSPCLPVNNSCQTLIGAHGEGCIITAAPVGSLSLILAANHPNPFNPSTMLRFSLDATAPVYLGIYSLSGRLVLRLLAGEELGAGWHERSWNGKDAAGRPVSAGVYLARIRAGGQTAAIKMTLLN